MWQRDQFYKLLENPDIKTGTFYQEDFGTECLKPTRLLLGGSAKCRKVFCLSNIRFDDQGFCYWAACQQPKLHRSWKQSHVPLMQLSRQH